MATQALRPVLENGIPAFGACRQSDADKQSTNALIITPSFDSSITTALNADAIESSILKVINTYDSLIADPIDVSIYFRRGPVEAGFASQSASTRYAIPYGAYTESLVLNAALFGNPVLTTAVATLTTGNKSDLVGATSASLRALLIAHGAHFPGLLGTDGELGHGTFDGVIFLSPSETVFQYSRPVPPHRIDAMWAIAHEINEVLGVGGIGSILPTKDRRQGTSSSRWTLIDTPRRAYRA